MKTTMPDFKLRLPQALKDQIEEAAAKNNRSMNGEILERLEFTFSVGMARDGENGVSTAFGPGSHEWDAATRKTQTLEQRVKALEERLSKVEARGG
ncbi:Arc family DNA-binding protein [Rhizobium sp. GN54]|uniref:Arc family DNA-binding protein n=1 Tax=Rhizobium sp. GN54 TaxID=2898150 RepID=UPI001E4DDBF7|nr:Arc family DNA-binding protein [Rhizobium sp. GN54]MCD2185216.1 Arc family DNA-binding protein [Rhizobium sp. GN54]